MRSSRAFAPLAEVDSLVDAYKARFESQQPFQSERHPVGARFFENRICLSISETAGVLGVSQKTVERMVKRGELKSKRVGRRVLILRSAIEAWPHS